MGIETPQAALTGYIQMVDGQWGYAEPFEVIREAGELEDSHRAETEDQAPLEPPLTAEQRGCGGELSFSFLPPQSLEKTTNLLI